MKYIGKCILSTIESDSHMWNLVYMELLLNEYGFDVHNLGCCVAEDETVKAVMEHCPDLVVISTLNGHGYVQGKSLIENYRQELGEKAPTIVIGGNLSTNIDSYAQLSEKLLQAGFDGVFTGPDAVESFDRFLHKVKLSRAKLKAAS